MPSRRKLVMPTGAPALATVPEWTLYPSRKKWALVLLISLLFCAATPLVMERNPFIAWLGLLFFGICGVISLVLVLVPGASYLRLTGEGFVVRALFRTRMIRWQDVSHFGVTTISMNVMVGYNFSRSYVGQELGRKLSADVSGWEAALPDTSGMDAQELADLMNQWKRRSDLEQATAE